MRKEFLLVMVVGLLFVAGCTQSSFIDDSEGEIDLLKEIQEIEEELERQETGEGDVDDAVEEIEDLEETDEEPVDVSSLQVLEVDETDLVALQIDATDSDEDAITYTFSAPLDENGKWQTNYGDAGEYVVTVTASDGENVVSNDVLLIVQKKNVPPEIAGLPGTIEVDEGAEITLEPDVSDANKDDFTVSFSAPFDDEGVFETDHMSAGEYEVTVTASDGEASSEVSVLVVVNDVNVPPELSGLDDEITVDEGETVSIEPDVTDLDGDEVELSISDPVGDDGLWETGFTDHGEYVVTVTASDGKDTVSEEVMLTVNDVNVPPQIIAIELG